MRESARQGERERKRKKGKEYIKVSTIQRDFDLEVLTLVEYYLQIKISTTEETRTRQQLSKELKMETKCHRNALWNTETAANKVQRIFYQPF